MHREIDAANALALKVRTFPAADAVDPVSRSTCAKMVLLEAPTDSVDHNPIPMYVVTDLLTSPADNLSELEPETSRVGADVAS